MALHRCAVGWGKDVGGSGGVRVAKLRGGSVTRHNHGTKPHGVMGCEGFRLAVLQLTHDLFKNGTSQGLCFSDHGTVALAREGSALCVSQLVGEKQHPKNVEPYPPPSPCTFPTHAHAVLRSSGPRRTVFTVYLRLST